MVAGHRRKFASELAGKVVMPCIVRNLTQILRLRSSWWTQSAKGKSANEKAFAYKMKLDAMKDKREGE